MFPMSHLYIASRILKSHPLPDKDAAAFLLGSIAPDAVQDRADYNPSMKLVSHLCPDNGEIWGRITDNARWKENVRKFICANDHEPFALGYATHIFGDIFNNEFIWTPIWKNDPSVAAGNSAKGHVNVYYSDFTRVDTRLYYELMKDGNELRLLAGAIPQGLPGLVTGSETAAFRDGVINEKVPGSYPNKKLAETGNEVYVTWEKLIMVIEEAAEFALPILFPNDKIV